MEEERTKVYSANSYRIDRNKIDVSRERIAFDPEVLQEEVNYLVDSLGHRKIIKKKSSGLIKIINIEGE